MSPPLGRHSLCFALLFRGISLVFSFLLVLFGVKGFPPHCVFSFFPLLGGYFSHARMSPPLGRQRRFGTRACVRAGRGPTAWAWSPEPVGPRPGALGGRPSIRFSEATFLTPGCVPPYVATVALGRVRACVRVGAPAPGPGARTPCPRGPRPKARGLGAGPGARRPSMRFSGSTSRTRGRGPP